MTGNGSSHVPIQARRASEWAFPHWTSVLGGNSADGAHSLARRACNLHRFILLGTSLIGFLSLLLAFRKSWLQVPLASAATVDGQFDITTIQPAASTWFQCGALLFAILIALTWLRNRCWTRASVAAACVWLLFVFAFPWFAMLHNPEIAARATWLQMQHDNLTWLGGDINTSQEMSSVGWKNRVYVVDAPRQVAVIRIPNWSPLEFGIHRLPCLVEWLGYTNAFCQFVTKGWILAVLGAVAILVSSFFDGERLNLSRVGFGVATLAFGGVTFCIVAWSIPLHASRHLAAAGKYTSRGEFESAVESMESAARVLPLLREDTYFIAQRGLLDWRLNRDTPHAAIYHANTLEQDAFYSQALDEYEQILETTVAGSAVHREAARALLRYAVHSLNSGDNIQATAQLEHSLAIEPCNLKTIYMLQIAALRNSQHDRLFDLVDYTYELCDHLRFPTKKVILATTQQHALYAAMQDGDIDAAWFRMNKMRRP